MEDTIAKEQSVIVFCSPLLPTMQQTWRVGALLQHRLANEHYSAGYCSFFLLTSQQTLQVAHLIEAHMAT
jgi:hypothetical protein